LIAVEALANLNLAVANVALPQIGVHFEASQTGLDLVSVGFSLGLAGTVLYLGALGDRYGRKMMLILGVCLSIPAAVLAAYAPSVTVLIAARFLGGVAAGMSYPTTLALITALWRGPSRTKAIALWSAAGGAAMALASVVAGWTLTFAWWGSVFLITLPVAFIALMLAVALVPSHANENSDPVDHLGGALSIVGIVALVLTINFAPSTGEGTVAVVALGVAACALIAFFARQRRAPEPLFDLHYGARRIFWVAAVAGVIVFGTLMASLFIGEQFLQNVLGYSTLAAGAAVLPAAGVMLVVAPISASIIERFGSRITLLSGYGLCLGAFLVMLLTWHENSSYLVIALAFSLMGAGVGLAGTPASHSLTGSVPVRRAGMASGTADIQRDLGGAIMQSTLGALLTAGYASAVAAKIGADSAQRITPQVTNLLERSFSSATEVAKAHPDQATQIVQGAKESFLQGANWAYAAGAIAIVVGATLVALMFPHRNQEIDLLASYRENDALNPAPTL
jgi:MFS family permease